MPQDARPPGSSDDAYPHLKRRLAGGEFAPGTRLPSLREMARHYGLAVSAMHQVIGRLAQENLVQVRHGSGIYAVDLSSRPRKILLLNPSEGDHWSDYTLAFTQAFASNPRIHLLFEAPTPDIPGDVNAALAEKVRDMVREGLDAIVFNGMNDLGLDFINDLAGKVPLISFLLDEVVETPHCGRVLTDFHHGGYAGMRHLIETGCRRIVLTQHSVEPIGPLAHFLAGARAAVEESIHRPTLIPFVGSVHDPIEEALERYRVLHRKERPDGLFAHADWLGSRILTDMRRAGVDVPGEFSVLGYLNTPWTMMTDPPMSSVTTDPIAVVSAVRELFESRRFTDHVTVKPRLIVRPSTQRDATRRVRARSGGRP